MTEVALYKDTVTDLNNGYRELLGYMGVSDTRVGYLRDFEHVLSLNCPDKMLWQFEEYRELEALSPLPDDLRARVNPGVFRNYLLVYEQIMRKIGLVDKAPIEQITAGDFFDLGDARMEGADEFFSRIAKPGAVWLTTGERGGGKTHTAVAVIEKMVGGQFPSLPKVVVATNIIFYHRVGNDIRVETPPGVYHITTMRELFPIVVKTIEEYGRKVMIMLVLDEAQGFISGDSNFTNSSIPMKEMLGTIRKYNLMVWFLTPTARSVGPAFRNLMNAKTPGNLTCFWRKDMAKNRKWIAQNHLPCEPRELMAVIPYDSRPAALRVPVTDWTCTVDDLKDGGYCYDHIASAAFEEGEGFDFNAFNRALGGVASLHAMDAIKEFYRTLDAPPEEKASPEELMKITKARIYKQLTSGGITQSVAAKALGVARTTLNDWAREVEQDAGTRQTREAASDADDGRDGQAHAGIYLSKRTAKKRGARRPPSSRPGEQAEPPSDEDSEGPADPEIDTKIPDGTYSFAEMQRAVEYCLAEEYEDNED